jgi:Cu+-exporting ATPase
VGTIALADQVKSDSTAAIKQFQELGLHTVMLTGDNEGAAQAIASQVGIHEVLADVRPAEKAAAIANLQRQGLLNKFTDPRVQVEAPKKTIAMVGDGINDAPALAAADLGIAIGSGSDIAKETGGIVLVSGSLLGVAAAIRLSRATMKKIRQNLFFAFIYNVLAIPLAAFGLLNPLIAAGAMALSDVTVIGNALLLRRADIGAGEHARPVNARAGA